MCRLYPISYLFYLLDNCTIAKCRSSKTNLKFTLDSDYYVYVAESKDLLFLFRLDMQQYAISLTEDQYQKILSFTEE